jgi:hypothetical protein
MTARGGDGVHAAVAEQMRHEASLEYFREAMHAVESGKSKAKTGPIEQSRPS